MKILKKQNIEDIVFLDIETSYAEPDFNEESLFYKAWEYDFLKHTPQATADEVIAGYFDRASLFPEYGIITCITMGVVKKGKISLITFSGEEKDLLKQLNDALDRTVYLKSWLCGHTITMFDGPYIAKRCMVNEVSLHEWFDVGHLKPWEVPYLDLAVLWKGTGYKNSSLLSMVTCLGLPSPKDDISGKDAPRLFWEGEIKRICAYCEKDVIAVINLYMKLCGESPLEVKVSEGPVTVERDILTYLVTGGKYTDEIKRLLEEFLQDLKSVADKDRAIAILNAIPSRAKGKTTDITKKDIKELITDKKLK